MPVAVLERDELGAADSGDGPAAGRAALGEQLPEAVSAVRLVVAAGEACACQARVAICAGEAFAMPRLVLVGHAATGDHLKFKASFSTCHKNFKHHMILYRSIRSLVGNGAQRVMLRTNLNLAWPSVLVNGIKVSGY